MNPVNTDQRLFDVYGEQTMDVSKVRSFMLLTELAMQQAMFWLALRSSQPVKIVSKINNE